MEDVSKSSALKALISRVSKSTVAIIATRWLYVSGRGKHRRAGSEAGFEDVRASRLEACRNLA
jgi:hypothetical protein